MQKLLLEEQEENSLLRDITGVQRLEDVTFLDAVVDCDETSLSKLGEKMPLLRELKLNNSVLHSIRNLGSRLKHLQILWVSHCSLSGLEGLNALPCLKELYAAFNNIDNLEPVSDMEMLEILDLEGNRVDDLGSLAYLRWCPQLAVLTLADNPIATEPRYQAEVLEALPQLQVLDDLRLSRPLAPLSKLAAAQRYAASCHTASVPGPAQTHIATSTLLSPRAATQHLLSPAQFADAWAPTRPEFHPVGNLDGNSHHASRLRQRPASAGGLPQRLPPVASGRNQPGSYLLHSLAQMPPPDPLLVALGEATLTDAQTSPSMLQHREELIAQLCSSAIEQDDALQDVDTHTSSKAGQGRPVRPASAGFRRPGAANAATAASAADISRPSSAGSDEGTNAEAAGLFWRKHRLSSPQSLTLAVLDGPIKEGHNSIAGSWERGADNDTMTAVVQCNAVTEALIRDTPQAEAQSAELIGSAGSGSIGERTALHAVSQSASALQSDTGNSSLSGLHPAESSGEADSYEAERQHIYASPATSELQTVSQECSRHAAIQPMHNEAAQGWSSIWSATHNQQSTAMSASDQEVTSSVDISDHVTQRQSPQMGVVSHQQPGVQASVHAVKQHRGFDLPVASDNSSPADVRSDSSSFLQRLARERQPAAGAAHFGTAHVPQVSVSHVTQSSISHPPQSIMSQSADERPPTPERPATPSSRSSRRRNFVPIPAESSASSHAHLSQTTSRDAANDGRDEARDVYRNTAGFAGSNKMFAPMQDMDSAYMASISAKLALRPSSASAAQSPMSVGPALSWARSMQLPPGMLAGAAQQQHLLPKAKRRFNWGFDTPNGS